MKSSEHLNSKTNAITVEKEQYYVCNCGSKVLLSHKARHLKSNKHNVKKEESKEDEKKEEPKKEEKDYMCGCGKRVLKSNKYNHNNTSFHTDWMYQFIDEYTST